MSQIERIPISKVKPNESNPRTIQEDKFEALKKSLQEFPEMLDARPVVVDPNGVILGGNMRFRAAKEIGMKEIPVIRATWSEARQKEFIIKDNLSLGAWDWSMLANEWEASDLAEWGLDVWDPEVDLDDFFEDKPEDQESGKGKIILEFTEEDHALVIEKFNEIGGSKESIVMKLLGIR